MTVEEKKELPKQYKGVWDVICHYWRIYGGFSAVIKSPYLHASIVFALLVPLSKTEDWYDVPLDVLPCVLGFSLAGYALILALGDEAFRRLIAGDFPDGKESPFMRTNSMFLHFIVVQIIALLLALNAKARDLEGGLIAYLSYVAFVYSLLTALATGVEIFRCSRLFDKFAKHQERQTKDQ
ncbi:hypothetical protein PDESU_01196 [Pontiella desulfatans]|uniref:Uncharacterized protein n=1 Tax=Pontiella desulfatans TaxID=2750659 RepID=A0A6C2TYF7_PONDE|nr:hypothetical protein [Pontiella desulfatans]VGO12643.1 hypothetical protein PDESU_01196 [Pontiella desulfatans]